MLVGPLPEPDGATDQEVRAAVLDVEDGDRVRGAPETRTADEML